MRVLLLMFCLLFSCSLTAQDRLGFLGNSEEDLKVGLVLSGGGAKGFAHIGVLKALEESGVRIDYIAGTSMGAIVGGLYAAGYTANELDSIITNTDFTTLIQDLIPRDAKTFYEKEEADRYAITLPLENFKVGLPGGFSRGQNVYNLLSRLTQHVSNIDDFSKLPIPFLCIATDIETSEEVILDKGSLAKSIAASGALPSVFNPKLIDDKLLIDGGVVNNFPIDKIKSKVDIIIGVDVQDEPRTREDLNSFFDVMMQLSNFTTTRGMEEKIKDVDIYIHPDISDYTVMSFDKSNEIIYSGRVAANMQKDILKELAKKQKPITTPRPKIVIQDSLMIRDIHIEGNINYTRSYIKGKLKLKTNSKVSYKDFDLGIYNLLATRNFSSIDYELNEVEEGGYIVEFHIRESPNRESLRIAAHYDDVYLTSALLNFTRKRLLTNNDIFSFDFIIGDNLRYRMDYYIDKGKYVSLGLNSSYETSAIGVDVGLLEYEFDQIGESPMVNRLTVTHNIWRNRLYLETVFKRNSLLGLGAQHKWIRALSKDFGLVKAGDKKTTFFNSNLYSMVGYLVYDTFDDTFYPSRGMFFRADIEQLLFTDGLREDKGSFGVVRGQASGALPIVKNLTFVSRFEAGFVIGPQSTRALDFLVGGYGYTSTHNMVYLLGYPPLSLRGDSYMSVKASLDYEFAPKNHLNITYNIANVGDELFENGDWYRKIEYTGFAVGYGLETFFGPIDLKYSYSPQIKDYQIYVVVGYPF